MEEGRSKHRRGYGSSYTIPVTVAADAGSYDVVVSGTCTPSVTSAAATLIINALPVITGQPVASQRCVKEVQRPLP
jgi:hypothetical protein